MTSLFLILSKDFTSHKIVPYRAFLIKENECSGCAKLGVTHTVFETICEMHYLKPSFTPIGLARLNELATALKNDSFQNSIHARRGHGAWWALSDPVF